MQCFCFRFVFPYFIFLFLFKKSYTIDTMKVLIYFQDADTIRQSGIGRAMSHQLKALKEAGVQTTTDKNDTYDIAHINTYWAKSHRVLRKAKKKGIPVIVHGHSTREDFRNSFRLWKAAAPIYNHQLKYMYSRADLIITPTPYSQRLIEKYGYGTKVVNVSNGIDMASYAPNKEAQKAFRERFGIKENEKFVMGVGFPFQRKGIFDFFEVAKAFPDVKFIWFGSLARILTPLKNLKAIKHRPSNVIMAGYCKGNVIHGAYQTAACLFFPSYEETEGIVVLEALASRCPLVVRDIGVYEGWVKDGVDGHLCKNNEEFIKAISSLLADGERKEILDKGYEIAAKRDLKYIGQELKGYYQELLEEKKKQPSDE